MSSGCVFRNLFKGEKKWESVKARKALLQEFTSKAYNAEMIYVDNEGKTTEEQYGIVFQLSETQKDSEMIRVHGNAIIQNGEDTSIKASWSGIYLEKKHGYKMRLSGDTIEMDFYLYCDGNETINVLIKKTDPKGTSRGHGQLKLGASLSCNSACKRYCGEEISKLVKKTEVENSYECLKNCTCKKAQAGLAALAKAEKKAAAAKAEKKAAAAAAAA
jgi:hypothetical protein